MLRRRLLMQSDSIPKGFVDFGLPSGTLWGQGNIVKNGSTYAIGEETDYGAYFSWGNIEGHNEGEGYNFNSTTYNSTTGKSLKANIASNDAAHDAALACLGSSCHLPTKENFQELYDNTDTEWTTINGVRGRKFMKKTDHSVYIFLPAAGSCIGTSFNYRNSYGYYWSSSYYSSSNAYFLRFYSSDVEPQRSTSRYYGVPVRAVKFNEQMKGKLLLSFEEYNTTAASGYAYIEVYLDGVRINPNNTTYTSDGFSSISKNSTKFELYWDGNNDEHNKKIMSITVTYSGKKKTAYVIQDADSVRSTEISRKVVSIPYIINIDGLPNTDRISGGLWNYEGNVEQSITLDVEEYSTTYYYSGKTERVTIYSGYDTFSYLECNLAIDTDGTVWYGNINAYHDEYSTDEDSAYLHISGGNSDGRFDYGGILWNAPVNNGDETLSNADIKYTTESADITIYSS